MKWRKIAREDLQIGHQIWIEKANENLASAQLCFEQGHFNACANRLYYAMFHAAIAALAKAGALSMNKKIGHDWLQANFSSQLIHQRKVVSSKFRSYLPEALRIRVVADYEVTTVSQSIAASQLKKAKEFVEAIKQEVFYATQP